MSQANKTTTLYRTRVVAPVGVIKNAYGAHRLFWKAFPNCEPGTVQPFTFAEIPENQPGKKIFLMQSATRPDFSEVLGAQAETKELSLTLKPGDFFFFRLRATPTKVLAPVWSGENRSRGKRISATSQHEVQKWITKQAENFGFDVQQLVFDINADKIKMQSETGEKPHDFNTACAVFDGGLIVKDPVAFEQALFKGVGRGRSYGFGMLLISK